MQALPRLASRKAGLDNSIMIRAIRARRTMSFSSRLPSTVFRSPQRFMSSITMGPRSPRQSSQRTIFSLSRLPLKLEYQRQNGQPIQVQKVRFRRAPTRASTISIMIIGFYACYQLYSKLILDPLESAASEAIKNLSEEEIREMESEEQKPFFIPFPGTTKQLPPKPYKGSDPEWQEFVKFSKDKDLAKQVRDDLAQFVRKVAMRSSVLTLRLGKDYKVRRWWLDIDFPHHAPPEFERSGIEIGDDYINWGTRTVDSLTVFRIRQALWPSALFQSFWTLTKVLVEDDTKRLAKLLGFESSPASSFDQLLEIRRQQISKLKGVQTPNKDGPTPASVVSDPAKAIVKASEKDIAGKGPEEAQLSPAAKAGIALGVHFVRPILAFKSKLAQTWKPAPHYPPKGSIIISGMVELESTRAYLVFDVKSAWDPKTKEFDARSTIVVLRRWQLKKQGPAA